MVSTKIQNYETLLKTPKIVVTNVPQTQFSELWKGHKLHS